MSVTPERLARVTDVRSLLDLLRDELDWPLGEDDVVDLDAVTYSFEPEELALRPEHRARVREVKQLRPFETDQGWSVFFVNFESGRTLPVTVLRRILHGLTLRNRQGDAAVARSAWRQDDILFISAFGQGAEREVAFAHFHQGAGDLPRLDVLGWNEGDTGRRKAFTAARLGGLGFEPDEDAATRRERWVEAFQGTKRQTIRDSKVLARELARLASAIRRRVGELMAAEDETGHLRRMHAAFRQTLLEGLGAEEFADTFAQTVSYGLLAAAFSRGGEALTTAHLAEMVPATNPFLRGLFERFLHLGGRDEGAALDYDELGLGEVVDLLRATDMGAVRADFGAQNPGEDPVIHFYEDFLAEYDPDQKVKRGVFYTPQPVVSFIVRGVDQVLREEFGLPLGLADTATWGEVAARLPKVEVPAGVDPASPFVRVLDPATGTGTFLVEVIDLIERRVKAQWANLSTRERARRWQEYVERHLLPRLTGFELMMAPYAIAHMKVGLKLADTGYDLAAGQRLRVFLTNTMQPAREAEQREMDFDVEVLAREAEAASAAKGERYTVVMGNPPYSGHSQNPSRDQQGRTTYAGRLIEPYFSYRGTPLGERQPKWLHDDYVKFFAFAKATIAAASVGVISFITNHGFLFGRTFRGFREKLKPQSGLIKILDLGGSVARRETNDDENVFEIAQGVAITTIVATQDGTFRGHRGDLFGPLAEKYAVLANNSQTFRRFQSETYLDELDAPLSDVGSEWTQNQPVNSTFPHYSHGIVSGRDDVAIWFDRSDAQLVVDDFRNPRITDATLTARYSITNKGGFDLKRRRSAASLTSSDLLEPIAYRPFDERTVIYSEAVLTAPQRGVLGHLLDQPNVALACCSSVERGDFHHAFLAQGLLTAHTVAIKESNSVFPLFLRPAPGEAHRRPNLSPAFARALDGRTGLTYLDGLPRRSEDRHGQVRMDELAPPAQPSLLDAGAAPDWDGRGDLRATFGPRDVFDYVYAVLHAPSYRARYAEFLRSDFPRIPLPGGADPAALFRALTAHGRRLTALHLLDADAFPELRAPAIRLAGTGSTQLGPRAGRDWQDGKVLINDGRWFETVPKAVWEFQVGGYQPAQKWLKDRAAKGGANPRDGRVLTDEDVLHYRRFATALGLTIPEMVAVDATIAVHGDWPDAFLAREERRAAGRGEAVTEEVR